MSVTEWKFPGTAANLNPNSPNAATTWSDVDYIKADDTSYAYCVEVAKGSTYMLMASNFGFTSSDIPVDARIDGMEVVVCRHAGTASKAADRDFYYYRGGTDTRLCCGNNMMSATKWPTSPTEATYGGATNKWGGNPTQSIITSSDFGIGITVTTDSTNITVYCDFIKIRIYYTVLSLGAHTSRSEYDGATTPSITTTAGSCIILACTQKNSSTFAVPTDSKGNTWTLVGTTSQILAIPGGSYMEYGAFFKNEGGIRGSSHTFTQNSGTSQGSMIVQEVVGRCPVVDTFNTGLRDNSSPFQSNSYTPNTANEVLLCLCCAETPADPISFTWGDSFATTGDAITDTSCIAIDLGYRIVSSIASYTASAVVDEGDDAVGFKMLGVRESPIWVTGQGSYHSGGGSSSALTVDSTDYAELDSLIVVAVFKYLDGTDQTFDADDVETMTSPEAHPGETGTWSLDKQLTYVVSENQRIYVGIWSAVVTVAGKVSAKVTFASSSAGGITICEVVGADISANRVEDSGDNSGASGSIAADAMTTEAAGLFVGVTAIRSTTGITITPNVDYTTLAEYEAGTTWYICGSSIYRVTSEGLTDETVDWTSPTDKPWVAVAVAYKIASDAALIEGTTCWGHVTGVTETNVRTFSGNWTGTGAASGTGDSEVLVLDSGEYMESEVVNTGAVTIELLQNEYAAGDSAYALKYRTGATQAACEAAEWTAYSTSFASDGFVQVRVEN